ncbi:hypoxia-inducible HIG-1 [Elysia marginata]|uniref:Hypoxia-inducible HIG-1 n=1 Tax=Elysia marginata TaxID=1093978 RepID=A0AAV4G524_9GAST|nr:hypoxia-inducible HIG-1 [Elysia marginata]
MANITAELDQDELEDWFKIGAAASQKKKPEVVAKSALGGRHFDPETGSYVVVDKQRELDFRLPKYRRGQRSLNQNQYIEEYRQQEYDELMSQAAIVSTIESNQVTVIQGPTGSGKTTQIPQFILDYYAEESRYCNIIVTQPRKIAAMSVSKRVCDERGWELGSVCGYQIALARHGSEDTRILYCTTGILKEKLIARKNMHEFTHIMLDEVHERDIESDFALLLVKKLLRTNSQHVKIIVTSATFDTQVFAQYFALPVGGCLEPAPVIQVGTVHHQVSEFFADDLTSKLGEVPPVDEMDPSIHPAMYDMAVGLIKEFDLLEEKEQGKDTRTGFARVRGTVLIFLPGYSEIRNMCDKLNPYKDTHFLISIPLHSSITVEEQSKVFMKPAQGYRKIIISTNIAESSITVPDIKYVIDFCLTKNLCCDPDTNYTRLQLEWASKANTRQRKGRAGRVSNGRVYYMVPRWFYDRVLPDFGIPEMQRSPLESLILKAKIFEMGEPKALLALALSPPNLEDIERTILSLKEIILLIEIKKTTHFTLEYNASSDFQTGAAMSVKSIFANPMQHRVEAFKAKISWSDNSLSDCIAILNAYKVWESRLKMEEFQRSGANENQWGAKNFIQIKAIREVHQQVQDLEKRLLAFNIVKVPRPQGHGNTTNPAVEKLILKFEVLIVNHLTSETHHRQLGIKMSIDLLEKDEVNKRLDELRKTTATLQSVNDLRTNRAFVTFSWKPGTLCEGKIHPAVLTAIKIR